MIVRTAVRALLLILIMASSAKAQGDGSLPRLAGRVVIDSVYSAALEGNLLGDPTRQLVALYLPPGYDSAPARRYTTIYLLPPFDGAPSTWTREWPGLFGPRSGVAVMDSMMAAGLVPPMIIVMPNGRNYYHGSFFFNSSVAGNWEDFLIRDVVQHIDGRYRTIPTPASRGIAGHSMGGNAAVHLGMRHPDVFGAVYGLSPCCLAGYELFGSSVWDRVLRYGSIDAVKEAYQRGDFPAMVSVAVGVTITPNRDHLPYFFDPPYQLGPQGLEPSEPAASVWRAAAALAQVDANVDKLRRLRGLRMDHGNQELVELMSGTRRFSEALSARGVPHAYEVYEGDHHNRVMERLATRVLPFFAEALARQ